MKHTNHYIETLVQKGYSVQECQTPSKTKKTFPCTIGSRTFQTEEEYNDSLHEFLNGM